MNDDIQILFKTKNPCGGKLGFLGGLHAMGLYWGPLKLGVVSELCVRPYIHERVLFT